MCCGWFGGEQLELWPEPCLAQLPSSRLFRQSGSSFVSGECCCIAGQSPPLWPLTACVISLDGYRSSNFRLPVRGSAKIVWYVTIFSTNLNYCYGFNCPNASQLPRMNHIHRRVPASVLADVFTVFGRIPVLLARFSAVSSFNLDYSYNASKLRIALK